MKVGKTDAGRQTTEETDRHIEIKRQRSVRNSAALQVGNKCNECTTAFLYLEGAEGGDFS